MDFEILDPIRIRINEDYVLKLQSYCKPKLAIERILYSEVEEAYQLLQPRAIWVKAIVEEIVQNVVKIEDAFTLHAGDLAREWQDSQFLALAVGTIGLQLEERVTQLFSQKEFAKVNDVRQHRV